MTGTGKAIMTKAKDLIEKNRIDKICELVSELKNSMKMSIGKATEIGELLAKQKEETSHGKWMNWVKKNIPISLKTAERWMKLYEYRATLKVDNMTIFKGKDKWPFLGEQHGLAGAYEEIREHESKVQQAEYDDFLKRKDEIEQSNKELLAQRRPHYQPEGWNKDLEKIYKEMKDRDKKKKYDKYKKEHKKKCAKEEIEEREAIDTFEEFIPEIEKDLDAIWIRQNIGRRLAKIKDIKTRIQVTEKLINLLGKYLIECQKGYQLGRLGLKKSNLKTINKRRVPSPVGPWVKAWGLFYFFIR